MDRVVFGRKERISLTLLFNPNSPNRNLDLITEKRWTPENDKRLMEPPGNPIEDSLEIHTNRICHRVVPDPKDLVWLLLPGLFNMFYIDYGVNYAHKFILRFSPLFTLPHILCPVVCLVGNWNDRLDQCLWQSPGPSSLTRSYWKPYRRRRNELWYVEWKKGEKKLLHSHKSTPFPLGSLNWLFGLGERSPVHQLTAADDDSGTILKCLRKIHEDFSVRPSTVVDDVPY